MEALVETADAHPEAGAVGSKVLFPDRRLQATRTILWSNGSISQPWVGETTPSTGFDRLRAVDCCGTSSLLVQATAWDAVAGLDERSYPVYYVDVDLAPDSPGAIQHAVAPAEAFAQTCRAKTAAVLDQPPARAVFDPARHELESLLTRAEPARRNTSPLPDRGPPSAGGVGFLG